MRPDNFGRNWGGGGSCCGGDGRPFPLPAPTRPGSSHVAFCLHVAFGVAGIVAIVCGFLLPRQHICSMSIATCRYSRQSLLLPPVFRGIVWDVAMTTSAQYSTLAARHCRSVLKIKRPIPHGSHCHLHLRPRNYTTTVISVLTCRLQNVDPTPDLLHLIDVEPSHLYRSRRWARFPTSLNKYLRYLHGILSVDFISEVSHDLVLSRRLASDMGYT